MHLGVCEGTFGCKVLSQAPQGAVWVSWDPCSATGFVTKSNIHSLTGSTSPLQDKEAARHSSDGYSRNHMI